MESVIVIPLAAATFGPALDGAGSDVQAAHTIDAAPASAASPKSSPRNAARSDHLREPVGGAVDCLGEALGDGEAVRDLERDELDQDRRDAGRQADEVGP
jgi:hypothetical protein